MLKTEDFWLVALVHCGLDDIFNSSAIGWQNGVLAENHLRVRSILEIAASP